MAGGSEARLLREAVRHLERNRAAIDAEVERRLGRAEPEPAVRSELTRRFRSFCRLASIDPGVARPSLDGLSASAPAALERVVATLIDVAVATGVEAPVAESLRSLGGRFRAGIRRAFVPREPERARGRGARRPNAGRRVRAAIDRIGDAYLALCLETGRIYDLNPAAETLYGGPAAELLETALADLVAPPDRARYRELEARLDAGEDSGPLRLGLARKSGEVVSVELTVSGHTISGRRLAIFVAREREPYVEAERRYSTRTRSAAGMRATRESTARST